MKLVVVVSGLFLAMPVAGDEVPSLDVRRTCTARASSAAEFSDCQRFEETYRQRLAARWNVLPDYRKHFCEQSVAFQRPDKQGYSALAACLEVSVSS